MRTVSSKEGKTYYYEDRKWCITLPKEGDEGYEYIPIKRTCLTNKEFPFCLKCKTRYVPIDGKCFKCSFTEI